MIHPLARLASRFVIFWVAFLLLVHAASVFVVSYAVLYTPGSLWPGYAMMASIPVLSALFSALFFRGHPTPSARHGGEMALAWGALFALASALLNPFLYGIPWQTEFTELFSIAVDLAVVLGFLVPIFLKRRRAEDVPLLEHSESAWQPSSAPRPPEQA